MVLVAGSLAVTVCLMPETNMKGRILKSHTSTGGGSGYGGQAGYQSRGYGQYFKNPHFLKLFNML